MLVKDVNHVIDLLIYICMHIVFLPLWLIGSKGLLRVHKIIVQDAAALLHECAEDLILIGKPAIQHTGGITCALCDCAHGRIHKTLFHKFCFGAFENVFPNGIALHEPPPFITMLL